jgi:hypothetical protein
MWALIGDARLLMATGSRLRRRQNLERWEHQQSGTTMGHQEFKANPLKAIREHVENTSDKK